MDVSSLLRATAAVNSMNLPKRVLVLSTTFYPDPQVGAIRVTQWCRYLPSFGWEPLVLTRQYQMAATPEMLAADVHHAVRIKYLNDASPSTPGPVNPRITKTNFAKRAVASVARGIFVPDIGIVFWRSVRDRALAEARAFAPDIILSTSPTHSVHDLGRWLSKQLNVPWVADFRDVYLMDFSWKSGLCERIRWPQHKKFERSIYQYAAGIVHAIPLHARWASRRYPQARERIVTIPNGFTPELLDPQFGAIPASRPGRSAVRVVGSIDDDDILRLAKAIRQLIDQGLDIEFTLIGRSPRDTREIDLLLGDRFITTGYVPHQMAIAYIKGASLLVSYLSSTRARSFQWTSKLFEFIGSGNPTLEINPSRPDLRLLRAYRVPYLCSPTSVQLAERIASMLTQQEDRKLIINGFREHFTRERQTAELAKLLTRITGS